LGALTGGLGGLAKCAGLLGDAGTAIDEANASHIFRAAQGHMAEDTAANRSLLEAAVKSDNYVTTNARGVTTYSETLPSGKQIWVKSTKVKSGTAA